MGWFCLSVLLFMSAVIELSAFDTWPQNLLVATKNSEVSLECRMEQENVIWKSHRIGELIGQRIKVNDQPDTGNYSCWSQNKELLNFTYVVIDATPSEPSGIECHTNSYVNSTLHCTWNINDQLVLPALVRAKIEREGFKDYDWVYVLAKETDQMTVTFDLPNVTFCPFEDVYQTLKVTLEALDPFIYVFESKFMLFRKIVKPDHPQNVTVQKEGKDYYVTWEYPSSWTKPHSFFPLQFRVEQHNQVRSMNYRKNISMINDGETKFKVSFNHFRLSCKDLYFNSNWSDWTDWINRDGKIQIRKKKEYRSRQ
ncbi:interleukin-12 subunit beta isoform X2 [Microcaecilia unicolor]|nr:interleukin-12 subunit beta-like isoform X2 [Microcaecilia unicolor]